MNILVRKPDRKMERVAVDWMMMLKLALKKYGVRMRAAFI
jgi:hypothetical protein